jgi:hypothetical protein
MPREDIRRDRTSRLGSPAIDPFPPHPARSEKQRHQACRSSRARRPDGPTTDDTDRKPGEKRSCGRSQTSLYNEVRPHSSLGYLTPAAFAVRLREQEAAACQATGRTAAVWGAYALRPVARTSRKGQEKAETTVVVSTQPWSEKTGQVTSKSDSGPEQTLEGRRACSWSYAEAR